MSPRLAGGQLALGDALSGAWPIASNLVRGVTGRGGGRVPSYVTWALTERCPMRCRHCDMGRPTAEMDANERALIAGQLATSDVWGVSLIGGEPTLITDLADLAATLTAAGKHVRVGSSGWRLDGHLDALVDAEVAAIVISVDSHDAASHDAFRGRPGLFAAVVDCVERIRERRRGDRPEVHVRCTIHRGNFRQLDAFLEFWRSRADQVVLQVVQNNGIHTVRDDGVLFRDQDRPALEAVLTRLQNQHPFLRTPYFRHLVRYVFEPEALYADLGFRCLLVSSSAAVILPDGGVRICYGRPDSTIGSLRDSSLESLWQHSRCRQVQDRMQDRAFGCMCWEQSSSSNLNLLGARRLVDGLSRGVG